MNNPKNNEIITDLDDYLRFLKWQKKIKENNYIILIEDDDTE